MNIHDLMYAGALSTQLKSHKWWKRQRRPWHRDCYSGWFLHRTMASQVLPRCTSNMHTLCPGAALPPGTQSVMATEWEPPHRQAHFHTDEACAAAARSSVLWNFNDLLSVFSFFPSLLSTPCLCVRECLCVHVMRLRFGIQRDTNRASTLGTGGEQRQCDFEGVCIFTPGEHLLRSALLGFVRLATQPTF